MRYILIIIFITGCKTSPLEKSEQSPSTGITTITISESNVEESYDQFLVGEPRYVALETTNQSLIGSIDKIEYFQNNYFILDVNKAKALFCFDSTGLFRFKIDKVGKGPGEFFLPLDFNIDRQSESIKILDPGNRKILVYTMDGELIREQQLADKLKSFYVIDPYTYAMHIDGRSIDWERSNLLKLWNTDSEQYITEGVSEIGRTDTYPIKNEFSEFRDNVLFIHAWTDTIYKVTNTSISPLYAIDFGQDRISNAIKELELIQQRDFFMNNPYKFHKGQICENNELISFKWVTGNSGKEKEYVTYFNKENHNSISIGQVSNWKSGLSLAGPLAFDGISFIGQLIGSADGINNVINPKSIKDEDNPILVHYNIEK